MSSPPRKRWGRPAPRVVGAALVVAGAVAAVPTIVAALGAGLWWGWTWLRSLAAGPTSPPTDPAVTGQAEHLSALAGAGAGLTVLCWALGVACYRLTEEVSGGVPPGRRAGAR